MLNLEFQLGTGLASSATCSLQELEVGRASPACKDAAGMQLCPGKELCRACVPSCWGGLHGTGSAGALHTLVPFPALHLALGAAFWEVFQYDKENRACLQDTWQIGIPPVSIHLLCLLTSERFGCSRMLKDIGDTCMEGLAGTGGTQHLQICWGHCHRTPTGAGAPRAPNILVPGQEAPCLCGVLPGQLEP